MTARTILKRYSALPSTTRAAGSKWYAEAHQQAQDIAVESAYPLSTVVGVIARLSPACEWTRNLQCARQLCVWGEMDGYTGYPANAERARLILDLGWSDAPQGYKINAFYDNILKPSESTSVTLDRHMLRLHRWPIEVGPHRAAYYRMVREWQAAARRTGMLPHQVQAALWLAAKSSEVPF